MSKTHGLRAHRLYRIHVHIKERCYKPNTKHYEHYGGRGITMCSEWLNDFVCFYNWAYANGYQDNLTIDRRNNDGNYEPSNCRWITQQEQMLNRSNTLYLTYNGVTKTLHEWAIEYKICYTTLYCRYKQYGFSADKLFEKVEAGQFIRKKVLISDINDNPLMIVKSKAIAVQVIKADAGGIWRQMNGVYNNIKGFKCSYI
jgi:hypothetical protein